VIKENIWSGGVNRKNIWSGGVNRKNASAGVPDILRIKKNENKSTVEDA
jgi:hypothetical protein